jgi:hypothetical protein
MARGMIKSADNIEIGQRRVLKRYSAKADLRLFASEKSMESLIDRIS